MTGDRPYREECGAYVLGALTLDEHQAFADHLAGCLACRRDVRELQAAATALPLAATQHDPPRELKDRIMAVVESEAELLRAAGAEADRPPARRWSWPRPLPVAAALGLLVVAVALARPSAPERRVIGASSSSSTVRAHLEVESDHQARLVATGLPRPAPGSVYEVWLQRPGDAARPSGTFYDVALRGTTTEEIHGDLRGAQRLLVTVEPAPGSSRPTALPLVHATLT